MAIEFACPSCLKTLRVPDAAAGKQAKCPECGVVCGVPAGANSSGGSFPPPPPSSDEAFNPYAAPPSGHEHWQGQSVSAGAIEWQPLHLRRVFDEAISITLQRLVPLVLACILVAFVAYGFIYLPMGFLILFLASIQNLVMRQLAMLVPTMIVWIATAWLMGGVITFALKICRGQTASVFETISGGGIFQHLLGPMMLVNLALYVPQSLSTILLEVVGMNALIVLFPIYIAIYYVSIIISLYPFLIVDRRAEGLDAIRLSIQGTRGNRWSIFFLMLAIGVVSLSGIVLCFVGMLFTVPLGGIMWIVAYLHITGQPTMFTLR